MVFRDRDTARRRYEPRTALRTTIYSVFTWFSPNDDGTNYPTEVLRAGKTLTRVYSTSVYFPYSERDHEAIDKARLNEQSYFALSFTIAPALPHTDGANLSLKISHSTPISLPRSRPLNNGTNILSASKPFTVRSPAGETDGISPPWFDEADAVLLFASATNGRMYVTLRTLWNENGDLEIRTDGPDWDQQPPSTKAPLLTLSLSPMLSATVPEPPYSASPTSTFPIRYVLLSILKITAFIPLGLEAAISFILSAVIAIIGFLFTTLFWLALFTLVILGGLWYYRGRPDIGEFISDVRTHVRPITDNLQEQWTSWRARWPREQERTLPVSESQVQAVEGDKMG
uniref:Uncharacterized protein n=1 Tax=Coccidioides posadasii RMSCC 3488 TaxID=454284 RepID=A0A0J6FR02_COCPO|nr:hypothetical protein CPAG_08190 [Coccidioides posadasii RMSCC 3488]